MSQVEIPTIETMEIPDNYKIIFGLISGDEKPITMQLSATPELNPYLMIFCMYPNFIPKLTLENSIKDSLVFDKYIIFDLYCAVNKNIDKEAYRKEDGVDKVNRIVLKAMSDIVVDYITNKAYKNSKVAVGVGLRLVKCLPKEEFVKPISADPYLNDCNGIWFSVVTKVQMSNDEVYYLYPKRNTESAQTEDITEAIEVSRFKDAMVLYKKRLAAYKATPKSLLFSGLRKRTEEKKTVLRYTVSIIELQKSISVLGSNTVVNMCDVNDPIKKKSTTSSSKKKITTKKK